MTVPCGMLDLIGRHEHLLWWLVVLSAFPPLASVVLVPILIVRIPEDYFVYPKRIRLTRSSRHPALRLTIRVIKNLLGAVFVLSGIAMLVLPGQGVLAILAGLFLLEFPGKYRAERWLVRRRTVLKSINWLRAKLHAPPLMEPPPPTVRREKE